mmetsp:Transcript_30416/g.72335  ORF Transcript_30416/g.72335 Transcript_30416/m.72335 type:complete len:264 (+) Transcript_30416:1911-2702(+)
MSEDRAIDGGVGLREERGTREGLHLHGGVADAAGGSASRHRHRHPSTPPQRKSAVGAAGGADARCAQVSVCLVGHRGGGGGGRGGRELDDGGARAFSHGTGAAHAPGRVPACQADFRGGRTVIYPALRTVTSNSSKVPNDLSGVPDGAERASTKTMHPPRPRPDRASQARRTTCQDAHHPHYASLCPPHLLGGRGAESGIFRASHAVAREEGPHPPRPRHRRSACQPKGGGGHAPKDPGRRRHHQTRVQRERVPRHGHVGRRQ